MLTIKHNNKEYKWIGDKWGTQNIKNISMSSSGDIVILVLFCSTANQFTYHTPEQLVKLGYMEEVKENKEVISNYAEPKEEDIGNQYSYVWDGKKLEQPKEESQPQEDIELLPAYEPRAEDMSHDSATFDPAEWQLKLITDRLNQLIKANKK